MPQYVLSPRDILFRPDLSDINWAVIKNVTFFFLAFGVTKTIDFYRLATCANDLFFLTSVPANGMLHIRTL